MKTNSSFSLGARASLALLFPLLALAFGANPSGAPSGPDAAAISSTNGMSAAGGGAVAASNVAARASVPGRTITDVALAFAGAVRDGDREAALACSAYSLKDKVEKEWKSFDPDDFETDGTEPKAWLWASFRVRFSVREQTMERTVPSFLDEGGNWVTPDQRVEYDDYPEGIPETIDAGKALDAAAEAIRASFREYVSSDDSGLEILDSLLVGTVRFGGEDGENVFVVRNEAGDWVAVRNEDVRNFLGRREPKD